MTGIRSSLWTLNITAAAFTDSRGRSQPPCRRQSEWGSCRYGALFRSHKIAGRRRHGTAQGGRLFDPRGGGILYRCERGLGSFAIRHAPGEVGHERDEAATLVLGQHVDYRQRMSSPI